MSNDTMVTDEQLRKMKEKIDAELVKRENTAEARADFESRVRTMNYSQLSREFGV